MTQKGTQLYSGKAKTIFQTDDPSRYIMAYRDDATAFNGVKQASLAGKGKINNLFNAYIMQTLQEAGIPTHFESQINETESLVLALEMIPVESVWRNFCAGGLSKRLGIEEGQVLDPPVSEFFYKNDALGDPMINESHIQTFGFATEAEVATIKRLTAEVNAVLQPLFFKANIHLVDFKLEFGRCGDQLYLGDEFTPDGCRLWDVDTQEKLDKDRFRRDLGNVIASYEEVAKRLGIL